MNVLYCFNEDYARVAAVSLISYARIHAGTVFHIFTIGEITDTTYDEFRRIANKYSTDIVFYDVTRGLEKYKPLLCGGKQRLEVFARLLVTEYLPDEIDKILYLDGDTLVVSKLDERDFACGDNYVLGVYDNSLPPMGVKKSIGFDESDIYINAGVLLINVRLWRENNLIEKFDSFFQNHPKVIFGDQDAINKICKDKIGLMPLGYNLTFITQEIPYKISRRLFEAATFLYYSEDDMITAQNNPHIIHFAGETLGKPWTTVSYIKYTDEWREIDKETIWGDLPYVKRKYANSHLKSAYKMICEKLLVNAYQKKNYSRFVELYKIFYKLPHRVLTACRGKK